MGHTNHGGDTPEPLSGRRGLPDRAKVYADRRRGPDSTDRGNRGIERTKSHSDKLAAVRYHECGWEAWEIDSRLQQYEGIEEYDWK